MFFPCCAYSGGTSRCSRVALMLRSTSLAFFTSGSSTRTVSASAVRVSSCVGAGMVCSVGGRQSVSAARGCVRWSVDGKKYEEVGGLQNVDLFRREWGSTTA